MHMLPLWYLLKTYFMVVPKQFTFVVALFNIINISIRIAQRASADEWKFRINHVGLNTWKIRNLIHSIKCDWYFIFIELIHFHKIHFISIHPDLIFRCIQYPVSTTTSKYNKIDKSFSRSTYFKRYF